MRDSSARQYRLDRSIMFGYVEAAVRHSIVTGNKSTSRTNHRKQPGSCFSYSAGASGVDINGYK